MAVVARYAAETDVPAEKSRAQIEMLLRQHGATEYATGWDEGHDRIQFKIRTLVVRFVLPRVNREEHAYRKTGPHSRTLRTPAQVDAAVAQADRQRWRALYLVIRAKVEAVEANISTLEQEFLAFVVMSNGLTVGDVLVPQIMEGKRHLLLTGAPE